jgi:DNA-binding SARP family transcriptional activator
MNTQVDNHVKNELVIQLLGGFSVSAEGTMISEKQWRSRKARSLVKLQALAPGHRLHHDQVIDALWPDSDLTDAANNFHHVFYGARRVQDGIAPGCLVLEEGSRPSICLSN